jgi:hypothetical protein
MNKPAARKLLSHLIKQQKSINAARFNMHYFGVGIGDRYTWPGMLQHPVCNTQACLAGEAVLASRRGFLKKHGGIEIYKKYRSGGDIVDVAQKLLGLTREEHRKLFYFTDMLFRFTDMLFREEGWPLEFQEQYEAAKTPAERLEVAIRRLRHFIDTDGTDRPLPQSESERSQAELEPLPVYCTECDHYFVYRAEDEEGEPTEDRPIFCPACGKGNNP